MLVFDLVFLPYGQAWNPNVGVWNLGEELNDFVGHVKLVELCFCLALVRICDLAFCLVDYQVVYLVLIRVFVPAFCLVEYLVSDLFYLIDQNQHVALDVLFLVLLFLPALVFLLFFE